MKIRLVNSSAGEANGDQFLMSVLINDQVVIDAGCIGFCSPLSVQKQIRYVLLSHSHMDHVASLPILLDNVYEPGPDCPTVCGSGTVLDVLCKDIFNGRIWPDLIQLSQSETPFLKMQVLEDQCPIQLDQLRVTPIELDHVVPTMGFVIEEPGAAIAFVSDTSPTDTIWKIANEVADLKAVILESSFPTRMNWLAEKSKHLTPILMRGELQKLTRQVPVIVVHIKPAFRGEIEEEIRQLNMPRLEVGVPDKLYEF